MDILVLVLALVILLAVYFLPAIVASSNNHRQTTAIFILNLLLGWSFVAWVICFVWAVMKE